MHASPQTREREAGGRSARDGRRALLGAWVGFFVDMFDIYLPIVALAPANAYFEATGVSAGTSSLIAASIFAATLLGRPVGALLFGRLADTIGRRRTAIIAVSGFGTVTLAIAALPGYRTWGIAAVVILIVLRFVDGIFLGGEYTSATVLALESAPRRKRGLYGAFIMTGYPIAYCVIALITLGLLTILPADGRGSPYVEWGWRIPFVIGALIAFAFVAWYTYAVKESETWKNAEKTKTPLADMFRGTGLRTFLQVFVLMTGIWFVQNAVSSILPEQLIAPIGLDSIDVKIVQIVSYAILAGGYLGAGVLSQRIGRRPFFLIASVTIAVPATAIYGLLIGGVITGLAPIVIAVIAINLLTLSVWGVATTYLNERFHVGIRSTGYGIGYSFAVVIPAFYAFYQTGLATFMPANYTPLVLTVLAGALIAIGAKLSPETRDAAM